RLADPDLAGALRHRHQHDVHDDDAAHDEGDEHEPRADGQQDAVDLAPEVEHALEVSSTKLSSWWGRRCRRLRMMPSTSPIASRIASSELAFTISASITPGGFTSRWIGETAGAMTNLSSEMPSRLPRRSATPMTR